MENNDSPYIYEKPLRVKGARITKGIAALGLVAVGTVIGGTAFANSPLSNASASSANAAEPQVAGSAEPTEQRAQNSITRNAIETSPVSAQSAALVSLPLEQAVPKKNSATVQLPTISAGSFGNTSSATPSVGGSQTGSNTSSYKNSNSFENEREGRDRDNDGESEDEYED